MRAFHRLGGIKHQKTFYFYLAIGFCIIFVNFEMEFVHRKKYAIHIITRNVYWTPDRVSGLLESITTAGVPQFEPWVNASGCTTPNPGGDKSSQHRHPGGRNRAKRFGHLNVEGQVQSQVNSSEVTNNKHLGNLLTWCTTFKDVDIRLRIQQNALVNWAKLIPYHMQPVLFSSHLTPSYDRLALKTGWIVEDIPRVNSLGTPFMGDMIDGLFETATRDESRSVFYGFANGDILFDDSLIATLASVADKMSAMPIGAPILIVGRRTNRRMEADWTEPKTGFSHVEQLRREGRLFRVDAEDYFFFTRNFPVHLFADLLVGRPAYDNYLVSMSKRLGVSVIDATNTITALHQQSISETEYAGWKNSDAMQNMETIGEVSFEDGRTDFVEYETVWNIPGEEASIWQRSTRNIVA
jgi:hypothetical protein